jgi:hydroxypyruvate isomerase
MIPPWDHSEFFRKLDEGVEIAHFLGTPRLVVGSGTGFGGWKRQVQLDKLIEIYQKAIAQIDGSGVTLVLEPVNVRVDHPGSLLDRTSEAAYVARGVDSPFFGVLYDLYHSTVESENPAVELGNAGDLVKYVQIADAPGRGEPGTGSIDWPAALGILRSSGYDGPIGLEYYPQTASEESVAYIRGLAETA